MEGETTAQGFGQTDGSLQQDWASFCGRFKDQAGSKSESDSLYEVNGSMLLCAGGALSISVINTAEQHGCDIVTLEKLMELVEETCLLNFVLVFEKYRQYIGQNRGCKVQEDNVEAFCKAWSQLSEPEPQRDGASTARTSAETEAVIKTEEPSRDSVAKPVIAMSKAHAVEQTGLEKTFTSSGQCEEAIDDRSKSTEAPTLFHCHMCYQPFSRLRTLQVHKQKKHRLETVADYCCQLCGHEFYLLSTLKSHIHRKHFAQRHNLCLYCGKYFEDPALCRRHRLKHMVENRKSKNDKHDSVLTRRKMKKAKTEWGQEMFQCQVCYWQFTVLESLQNHIFRKHRKEKDRICRYCGVHFKSSVECRRHVREHLVERKRRPEYKCGLCPASFQLRGGLEGHVTAVHAMEQSNNVCGYCGKQFDSLEACCEHMQQKLHGESCEKQQEDEEELEGRKEVGEEGEMDLPPGDTEDFDFEDIQAPTKEEPVEYCCEVCDRNFETVARLQNHIFRRHHEERTLICRYCGKKFAESEQCSDHVRMHIAENRKQRKFHQQRSVGAGPVHGSYRCQLCSKTFQLDSALRSHRLRDHYAQKDQLCPSCGKFFQTVEECTRHRRLHFERRMFGSQGRSGLAVSGFTNCSCQLCGQQFKLLGSLEAHLKRKHPTNRYFLCRYCGKHFSTAQERKIHVRMHVIKKREFPGRSSVVKFSDFKNTPEESSNTFVSEEVGVEKQLDPKLVKCVVCGLEYQLLASLRRHMQRKHKDVKDRLCQHCGAQFDDVTSCKLHLQSQHGQLMKSQLDIVIQDPEQSLDQQMVQVKEEELNPDLLQDMGEALSSDEKKSVVNGLGTLAQSSKPWKCGLCGSLFSSRRNMRDHIRVLHSKEKEQMCYCCGRYFSDPAACQKHKQEDLTCEYCQKEFKTKLSKDNHIRRHVDERNFQCHICGTFYFDKKGLTAHYHRHSNAVNQSYQCEECGKVLSSKETLKYHMRIHRNERPFVCEICGKAFTQKVTWQNHQEIHTGIKPFECEVCGKRTRTRADMARHMPLHSDKKEFVCDVCGKAYRFPSGLQQHKSLHTGHRPHVCKLCGCTYRHSSELKKHMKTHRPGAKTRSTTVPKVPVPTVKSNSFEDSTSVPPEAIEEAIIAPPIDSSMTVIIPHEGDQHHHAQGNVNLTVISDHSANTLYHHQDQAVTGTAYHHHHQALTALPSVSIDNTHTTNLAMLDRSVASSYLDTVDVVSSRVGANTYTNDEMAVVVALQVLDEMVVVEQS